MRLRRATFTFFTIFGLISLMTSGLIMILKYNESEDDQTFQSLRKTERPLKIVHLDLKGAPPKISYLVELVTILYRKGCTGLLIEYEDMFPFDGTLKNISAKNAYTKAEIRKLVALAHDLNIEVIPLIQTFGHLEFVLKLEQFRELRELDVFPEALCPSKEKSLSLIDEMVTQVMALHPSTKFLHIGCDEVYHLAACSKCSLKIPRDAYTDHVMSVVKIIKAKYPRVSVLIWDDMIRQWPPQYLTESILTTEVEPMIWAYGPDVTTLVPNFMWYWYNKLFKRIWVAGAFKGASTSTSVFPDVKKHFLNQKSWLKVVSRKTSIVGGIVLTGWSRYDHFAILCELLPISVPSLFLSLAVISREESLSDEEIYNLWLSDLKCPPLRPFVFEPYYMSKCDFKGVDLFKNFLIYVDLKKNIQDLISSETQNNAWFTRYNLKYNFTSPYQLEQLLRNLKIYNTLKEVSLLTFKTRQTLLLYFDSYTTEEWIEQNLTPLHDQLEELSTAIKKLIIREVWPRKPL